MEPEQAHRHARVARILDDLDDVEERIEDLRPAGQVRSMVVVIFLFLVIAAAFLTVLFVSRARDLTPFLIAAGASAFVGLKSISAKNEELSELKQQRARITEGSTG